MTTTARNAIMKRLKQGRNIAAIDQPDLSKLERPSFGDHASKLEKFTAMITSVNAEVHQTTNVDWPVTLRSLLLEIGVNSLAYGPNAKYGETIRGLSNTITLLPFDKKIEQIKDDLFQVDAGFTATLGGIAETGSLIMRPGSQEPRLLSLVPPIHFALLDATRLFDTFWDAQTAEPAYWSKGMPTNALLISGPSKTADIEQTLTYGVHGPKRLIVLAVTDGLSD